jgi:CHASE1-domain containing sensor protein
MMTDWIAVIGLIGMVISVAVKLIVRLCLNAREEGR